MESAELGIDLGTVNFEASFQGTTIGRKYSRPYADRTLTFVQRFPVRTSSSLR